MKNIFEALKNIAENKPLSKEEEKYIIDEIRNAVSNSDDLEKDPSYKEVIEKVETELNRES